MLARATKILTLQLTSQPLYVASEAWPPCWIRGCRSVCMLSIYRHVYSPWRQKW